MSSISEIIQSNNYHKSMVVEFDNAVVDNNLVVAGVNVVDTLNELQSEIDVLNPENVQAITQALQVPSVDTFSSAPFQIEVADIAPPTGKGQFVAHNGSFIVLNNDDDSVNGAIGIKNDDGSLQINAFEGANDVNVICNQFLVNGAPIGGNNALSEAIGVPASGTYTNTVLNIDSIDATTANITAYNGSAFKMVSPSGAKSGKLSVDDSGFLNISGASVQINGTIEVQEGQNLILGNNDDSETAILNFKNTVLTLSANTGTRPVNIQGSALTFNGSPLQAVDVAMQQSIQPESAGTFANPPYIITTIGTDRAELDVRNNSTIRFTDNLGSGQYATLEMEPTYGSLTLTGSYGVFSTKAIYSLGDLVQTCRHGPTVDRPATLGPYLMYFDTDLGYPIWYNGVGWINALGVGV